MRIKLICGDCKKEFSCEKGKELRTYCPRCGSGNIIIPTVTVNGIPEYVKEDQPSLF